MSWAPPPLIFKPPLIEQVDEGQLVEFDLILVGKGIEYLPQVMKVTEKLEFAGNGPEPIHFRLLSIRSIKTGGEVTPSRPGGIEHGFHMDMHTYSRHSADSDTLLRIDLLTPLQFESAGGKPLPFTFLRLVESVVRRLENLSREHCEYSGPNIDGLFQLFVEVARNVQAGEDEDDSAAKYVLFQKRHRKHEKMPVGGFVGPVLLRRKSKLFEPILKAAAYLGAGKKPHMGLGQIAYQWLSDSNSNF